MAFPISDTPFRSYAIAPKRSLPVKRSLNVIKSAENKPFTYPIMRTIKNPDKKMLRDRMEKFTSEIKSADGYIYGLIEKNYKVFRMLNKLHMNEKVYQKVFIPMVHLIRK